MFEKVRLPRPKRSAFKLSYNLSTTMDIGVAQPTMIKTAIPGDTFKFGQVAKVELSPLISPFKGELWLESCAFFVSYDTLALDGETKFTEMLSHITDTQEPIASIPKWELDKTDVDEDGILNNTKVGSLWDKCGFPTNLTDIDDYVTPIAYIQRAFNQIYNEYIRDENLDEELNLTNNVLPTVCYKKDYFTSAFTSPQKGEAPTLAIQGFAQTKWSDDVLNTIIGLLSNYRSYTSTEGHIIPEGQNYRGKHSTSNEITYSSSVSGSSEHSDSQLGIKVNQELLDLLNDNSVDVSDLVTFNINDLRLLNKLQLWLERNQLVGNRTKEYLLANYGLAPSDETLQRPVFLGRLRTPVSVSSNLSSVETAVLPQGHRVGVGGSTQSVLFKTFTAKEPGVFIVVSFLRPRSSYSQGIDKEFIMNNLYDYPNPIFENLGQQPILNAELFVSGVKATDLATMGYQDNYVHLKCSHDVVTSELRANESLSSYSIHRYFEDTPTLSSEFIHVNPEDYDYLFAVENQPHCVATFSNVIKAIRPLHKFLVRTI